MKNFKIVAVFVIALILNACGGPDKMRETADLINFTATPQVLVEQGNDVKASVVVLFPEKYFINRNSEDSGNPKCTFQ
jgi:hypothetical protein